MKIKSYEVVAEFLQISVAFVDVVSLSTQGDDVRLARVLGDVDAHCWELLANLTDTRSLRADDQTMKTLL